MSHLTYERMMTENAGVIRVSQDGELINLVFSFEKRLKKYFSYEIKEI